MIYESFIEHTTQLIEKCIKQFYESDEAANDIFVGMYEPFFNPDVIVESMNIWCTQVNKLINIADELDPSGMSIRHKQLTKMRGCTYGEYYYLFKDDFDEKDYFTSPAHKFLAVYTQDHIKKSLEGYSLNVEDYVKFILKSDLIPSRFFLRELSAFVPYRDLLKHAYIPARTGHGKSELLKLIFYNLTIKSKKDKSCSLILIEPHGDLSEEIVRWKHFKKYGDRLIYIYPKLAEGHSPVLNPLELKNPTRENVTNTVGFFIKALEEVLNREGSNLTETMVDMLEKCLYFLLYRGNCTLKDLVDLLYLDPNLLSEAKSYNRFFENIFPKNKLTRDSLRSRIGRLLNNDYLNQFLVGKSTFDLEKAMNSGKIIIFNLGYLDELVQEAFGKFIMANIKSIARRRPEKYRKPTFVFIDECQNFISGSIEYTLSQLRKFGLHLILSNQYLKQLEGYQDVVKSQTLVKIVGITDADNAKILSSNLGVKDDEIINLPPYHFIVKSGSRKPIKIRTVDSLVFSESNTGYYVSNQEAGQLKKEQLGKYYKSLESTSVEIKPESTTPLQKNNPPFDLYLGNDDSTAE
jgi:DNA helicase HerA-like ATPase